MGVQEAQRSGKLVFDIEHLSVSYDDQVLIKDFSAIVLRGDRIGLVGDNGVGKTTLIKAILGDIPHQGTVKVGTQLEVAYFDQLRNQLDLEISFRECIRRLRFRRCKWPAPSYLQLPAGLPVFTRACPHTS